MRHNGYSSAPGDAEVYAGIGETWHGGRAQAECFRSGEDVRSGCKYTLNFSTLSSFSPSCLADRLGLAFYAHFSVDLRAPAGFTGELFRVRDPDTQTRKRGRKEMNEDAFCPPNPCLKMDLEPLVANQSACKSVHVKGLINCVNGCVWIRIHTKVCFDLT